MRSIPVVAVTLALAVTLLLADSGDISSGPGGARTAELRLVSARDHIEGAIVTPQSVYADRERIYLATAAPPPFGSHSGRLFVLARDRSANFPVLEVIEVSSAPLTAVRGDRDNLYVTSGDGNLYIYRKDNPLALIDTVDPAPLGVLSSLALYGDNLYIGAMAVSQSRVYVAALNPGEIALEVSKKTLTEERSYGTVFEPGSTVVFDRRTGERVTGIPFPPDWFGRPGFPSTYADRRVVAQTVAGCCGSGIFLYDPRTLALDQMIPRPFTNTVIRHGSWLIGGNEGGQVDLLDLRDPPRVVFSADLRALTGHTRIEDIEIRALWMDHWDNLIFAGSSWGNDLTRGPELPSFFVLELAE